MKLNLSIDTENFTSEDAEFLVGVLNLIAIECQDNECYETEEECTCDAPAHGSRKDCPDKKQRKGKILDEDDVRQIRASLKDKSYKDHHRYIDGMIMHNYGISRSTLNDIKNKKTWKNVK